VNRRLALGWTAALWGVSQWLAAAPVGGGVSVILSDSTQPYHQALGALLAELEQEGLVRSDIKVWLASDTGLRTALDAGANRWLITMGGLALEKVLQLEPRSSVLATMIPRSRFDQLRKEYSLRPGLGLSAVYLDQPVSRQLDLLRLALPTARKVGVLWGPDSLQMQAAVAAAIKARGLELVSGTVAPPQSVSQSSNLFAALKNAIDGADVLWALADPMVFNATTVSNILMATYRERVPVLAFSPGYVKAGALLSLHSTAVQGGRQAGTLLRSVWSTGNGVPAQYSTEFDIAVNEHVARSLGLSLDATHLVQQLRRMEARS
jgi:putative tryptophan/tyrosine transport system substrate-binding protein